MDSVCYICVYVCVYNTYMLLCAIIEFKRKRLWILEVGKTQEQIVLWVLKMVQL